MLSRHGEDIEGREMSGLASPLDIQLSPDAPNDFRRAPFGGKHARQEQQVAGLYCLGIRAERLRRRRQRDPKLLQPLLGARHNLASYLGAYRNVRAAGSRAAQAACVCVAHGATTTRRREESSPAPRSIVSNCRT